MGHVFDRRQCSLIGNNSGKGRSVSRALYNSHMCVELLLTTRDLTTGLLAIVVNDEVAMRGLKFGCCDTISDTFRPLILRLLLFSSSFPLPKRYGKA